MNLFIQSEFINEKYPVLKLMNGLDTILEPRHIQQINIIDQQILEQQISLSMDMMDQPLNVPLQSQWTKNHPSQYSIPRFLQQPHKLSTV
jgi:hypothetical protein